VQLPSRIEQKYFGFIRQGRTFKEAIQIKMKARIRNHKSFQSSADAVMLFIAMQFLVFEKDAFAL